MKGDRDTDCAGCVDAATTGLPASGMGRAVPADRTSALAALALSEYEARRQRDALFEPGLFAEPAWDMLLDLYVHHHRRRPVSIQSLCIAAAVPQTTAIRWIRHLADIGLVARQRSDRDNRVVHIVLTARGIGHLERYLGERLHALRTLD